MTLPHWLEELIRHNHDANSFELFARFAFLVVCLGGCGMLWHFAPIDPRDKRSAAAAGIVHFVIASCIELLVVNRVYTYRFTHHMLWGVPFDVQLAWAILWGTGLCIAWRSVHGVWKSVLLCAVVFGTLGLDFAALKSGAVFMPLTPVWWAWDAGALIVIMLGTLGFYQLILEHRALYLRAIVYGVAYAFIFYLLLPALILTFSRSQSEITAILQPPFLIALIVCSIPGVIAAVQFALEGDGSPVPMDPTRKLVTTGCYAYVRNPMQLSGLAAAVVWALAAGSWVLWFYVVDLAILLQLTKAYEDHELTERFGEEFERYRNAVRMWIPRLTAYRKQA
ncbi:MAG: isoprenylcysteine carboxylmethyltransferase family protein [Planctomycetota bacterium]